MEYKVGTLMEEAITPMGRSEDICGMTSDMMRQLPPEPSRQGALEDLVMNFIHDQEEKVKQLEEYMCVIGSDFMQLSSKVIERLKEEIRIKENGVKKIKKITRYPDTEDIEPFNDYELSEALTEKASFHTPKFVSPNLACNHDTPLSSREIPSLYGPKPQPQPFPRFPSLVDLGEERDPEQPIKPPSLDSFRMKEVDHLTIHTPPSPYVASSHPKDMYCYYRPCIDDPKKHYGFKLGLLGYSESLGVNFSNIEMIENEWELESKEVSFLGRGLIHPLGQKKWRMKFLIKNEEEIFILRGDGVRIKPDGVASPAMLYLTRRSLEVLRKFHWTTLGGRSNQLSHVSSPLLSKPKEY
ncbi:hypothetical protein Tco_0969667 [Tanacetum coccineum]